MNEYFYEEKVVATSSVSASGSQNRVKVAPRKLKEVEGIETARRVLELENWIES